MQIKRERVERIFAGMRRVRVAVVGDLMLDRYIWGEVDRISPEAPVPVLDFRGESSNLGGAANVAANAAALGAQVELFGVVGDDLEAERFRELLKRNRFGIKGIVAVAGRLTSVKTRVIAGSQHVVRIDREVRDAIDSASEKMLLDRFHKALGSIHAVILEDYNKGTLTLKIIRTVSDLCRKAGIPVGVDPKRENFWEYRDVTLFKPNIRELQTALGKKLDSDNELKAGGKEAMKRLKAQNMLVTRGEKGMALFTGSGVEFIPTRAQRVHDVSGAGDTVIATIMTALAGGADIREAAILANHAASIVIAEVGAVPVDVDELKRACLV